MSVQVMQKGVSAGCFIVVIHVSPDCPNQIVFVFAFPEGLFESSNVVYFQP